jgi:hypothetical protein
MTKTDILELIAKAARIASMDNNSLAFQLDWNALEDHILGKLTIQDLISLEKWCDTVPSIGSCVILAMLPDNLAK